VSFRDRHPGTITDALTRPGPVISVHPDGPGGGDQQHIWWLADGRILTWAIGKVPARSPYQPGHRVVGHGWRGRRSGGEGREHHGFRGFVLGGNGRDHYGLTDDGYTWHSSTALLDPADQVKPWESCTCCPHPPKRAGKPAPAGQGDLLDLIGVGV
jgi:hypothetical protein